MSFLSDNGEGPQNAGLVSVPLALGDHALGHRENRHCFPVVNLVGAGRAREN